MNPTANRSLIVSCLLFAVALVACPFLQNVSTAESAIATNVLEVLPPNAKTTDRRVTDIKTLRTPQDFKAPNSFDEWKNRKEQLREKILVATGLWPMPEIGDLHAEVYEKKEHEDYTVEKVLLRTYPGYYATGNLYRPVQKGDEIKQYPGLLLPHGHWEKGRLEDSDRASVPRRAVTFAKQGYVAFTYDMVGYADNRELLPHDVGGGRESLWGITPPNIQTLTSLRALDFIQSLEDVDPERIGVTGASGGGTQTFFLYGIDDRVKVAAPVNMISSTMQGGCVCENAPGLRIDTNNMEIGALMAPRPLLMVSASGDWTRLTPEKEFPAVRSVYWLYGVPQRVEEHQQDMGHNYNIVSRNWVYDHFRRFFYPNRPPQDFVEDPNLVIDATEDLKVFSRREKPSDVLEPEALFASLRKSFEEQLWKTLQSGVENFEDTYGEAYRMTLAVSEPDPNAISTDKMEKVQVAGQEVEKFLLKDSKTGQVLPANLWMPDATTGVKTNPTLMVNEKGKAALVTASGTLSASLESALKAGSPVLSIDVLATGEFLKDASSTTRDKKVDQFPTYNLMDTECRIQDVLLGETYLRERFGKPADMVGSGEAGAWVLLAHGLAKSSHSTKADLSGLDFTGDKAFLKELFIPNLRRYGDFVTSIVLGRDRPVSITGVSDESMSQRLAKAEDSVK
ncbi:MAG: acetylxylan esterase [Candidatus Omnitrophica bacterium]|nr:acetylxylan esterase [Candidatus Omnitrophota bacterium]